jgi:hypothetical protein
MSEGTFLLLYGLLFGVPLTLALIGFLVFMIGHSRDLDRSMEEIDRIRKEREERERLNGENSN